MKIDISSISAGFVLNPPQKKKQCSFLKADLKKNSPGMFPLRSYWLVCQVTRPNPTTFRTFHWLSSYHSSSREHEAFGKFHKAQQGEKTQSPIKIVQTEKSCMIASFSKIYIWVLGFRQVLSLLNRPSALLGLSFCREL